MTLLFALRGPRRSLALSFLKHFNHASDTLPTPPFLRSVDSPEDKIAARSWIAQFKKLAVPKRLVKFTFARSSGPGGQNVNKVNTKASLRCNVDAAWIPAWARPQLRRSSHYVSSSDEILITSTVHRSQSQNVEECLSEFHTLLVSTSSSPIKSDPTEEQKQRIRGLERAGKSARRKEKAYKSDVKKGRQKRDWD
ncbi:hypothetical protein APHAL10511_005013 [Amanita phalloides]|nr:hypothetical protein APHAL10511_005013 [Amanita phalloides]